MLVTLLRFSNVLGDHMDTPFAKALRLPVVPEILGFDPRLQFTHEDDVDRRAHVRAPRTTCRASTTSPATARCRGARCARSSASGASRCRRCSPTWRPSRCGCCASSTCRRRCWPAALRAGVDNTRFKRAGFRYRYTTAGAVDAFARSLRLESAVGDEPPGVQVRARRRDVLPPLPRRRPRRDEVAPVPLHVEPPRTAVARPHPRRPRPPQRADRRARRRDRRRGRRRSRTTTASARSSSPARRRRSAPAPTSAASRR